MSDQSKRTRTYCFTLNNWTQDEYDQLVGLKYTYLVIGKEIAPTTLTPHLQGFIHFKEAKTLTAVSKLNKRIHWEASKGSPAQNRTYCIKEGDYQEWGTPPEPGKRTDIELVREMISEGNGMNQIIEKASNYQCLQMAEKILKYRENKRNWKPNVKWYYGPTGTGKTRTAYEELPDAYITMGTGKWWDGYDAHPNVIIDDIRWDFMPFSQLLRLLDRYPFMVENKGGSRQKYFWQKTS